MHVTLIVLLVLVQKTINVVLVSIHILMKDHVTTNVLQLDIMKTVMNGNVNHAIQLVLLVIVEIATVVHSVMIVNTYMIIHV